MARGDKRYREERRKKGGRRGGEKFARKIILTGRANKNGAYPGILPAFSPSPSLSLSSCDRSRAFREIFHGEEKIAPRIYSKHDEFVVTRFRVVLFNDSNNRRSGRILAAQRIETRRDESVDPIDHRNGLPNGGRRCERRARTRYQPRNGNGVS